MYYWLYLIIFIVAIIIPDIFREDYLGISHELIQEVSLFLLGIVGFLFFVLKEHQLTIQQKEKEREQRRLQQTARDLIESYSYIGEINRKMDLLMQIGIGLSDRSNLDEKHVGEIYQSITESASFLLKAKCSALVFFNIKANEVVKYVYQNDRCSSVEKNIDFFSMEENIFIKQSGNFIIFSTQKVINDIRCYLIIESFDEFQGHDNNNQEILKYLAAQALILYSYIVKNPC